LLALPLAAASTAQAPDPPAFATERAHVLATGQLTNTSSRSQLVDTQLIVVPGAPSLRVFFRELNLGADDYLDVTSFLDGEVHRLTPAEVVKWDSSSAFFNGDTLLLELHVAPGSTASYDTTHLLVGLDGADGRSICGADNRVASTDNRSSRFLNSSGTGACTGWMGPNNCAFTAGHCTPGYTRNVAEFNVPPSTTSGALVHPPVVDQFPFNAAIETTVYTGLGDDWTVTQMAPNTLGELPYLKFGFFNLGFFNASPGDSIRITGYGVDSGTTNQTQQTDAGPYFGTSGTSIRYTLDTDGGNSGSPVIHEPTGLAIGIHTNGGCGSVGYNSGSGNLNAGFTAAYNSICVPPAVPVASFTATPTTVVVGSAVNFTDTSTGLPTNWAWDFDGDSVTDSTSPSPSHVYAAPGTYDVSLTVSNSLGSDTVTQFGLITVNPVTPAALPYSQDFSGGLPGGGEWGFSSDDPAGSITTGSTGTASPISGSPSLMMASSIDGGPYVTNDAVLHVDLSGTSAASLSYWFKETNDEDHPEDGVFLSDGTTEVLAVSHNGASQNWTQYNVDIAAVAAAGGLSLTSDFRIIFRQNDNYTVPTDGAIIDDISVTGSGTPALTGTPSSLSVSAGGAYVMSLNEPTQALQTYFLLGTTSGTTPGITFSGLTIPLNPDNYFNILRYNPNGLVSNSLGTLSATGTSTATLNLPAGAPPSLVGRNMNHAFVVLNPSGPGIVYVSNATTDLALLP
jgi:PKD repeat protein